MNYEPSTINSFPMLYSSKFMIGSVRGKVLVSRVGMLLIEVNGIGYTVFVPPYLEEKYQAGSDAFVYTYHHVREAASDLFGFGEFDDLLLFERFLDVSGIGPKTALGIFSAGERNTILSAIAKGDVEFFTKVPRLGRKNAQKIILELKGKIDFDTLDNSSVRSDDVTDTLKGFGFSDREIGRVVKDLDASLSIDDKIKTALKALGR